MLNRCHRRRDEQGVALVSAIAVAILAAFIIGAIVIASMSSADSAKERLDESASTHLARDAGAALATAYSGVVSGEFDGFVPSQAVLQRHASNLAGASVVANSSLPSSVGSVDPRVPGDRRFTVRQDLQDGRIGYWQIYSVKMPDWGISKGGQVAVYVRVWTSSQDQNRISQPMMYQLKFRPLWFADMQLMVDGPIAFGQNAVISGRVHSNGYETSFYNGLQSVIGAGNQVQVDASGSCVGAARITYAARGFAGPGSCSAVAKPAPGVRYNLLRSRDLAQRLRDVCTGGGYPSIQLRCLNGTAPISVSLAGTTVNYPGGSASAAVQGNVPGNNQGAVIVASGRVNLTGRLSPGARATIIAAAPPGTTTYGVDGAPSIWVKSGGAGASNDPTSSVGLVAEGDIVVEPDVACPVEIRGALLSMTGMLSVDPQWRVPSMAASASAPRCAGAATVAGSIAGHFAPALISASGSGYATRTYTYNNALYDNPPPLYPTAGDWEVTAMAPANLDCFDGAGQLRNLGPGEECA